jgi:hypothetical protein
MCKEADGLMGHSKSLQAWRILMYIRQAEREIPI